MLTIIDLAMPFFGLIVLGLIAARIFAHDEAGLVWLNAFVVYFALPALIFLTIAAAPFARLIDWPFFTATTLATYIAFLVPFAVSVALLGTGLTRAAIQGMAASYGNVGYMGLPLAVAFFGPEAVVPAVLIFCFDCTLQFTLVPLLAALGHRRHRGAPPWRVAGTVAWSILAHPFIVATLFGAIASALVHLYPGEMAALRGLPGVQMGATLLEFLSRAAGPVALFALGVTVGMRRFSGIGPEFPMLVAFKLLVHPLLAFATLSLLGDIDPLWLHVALMMAALPTATNTFVLATQYQSYIEGASSSILVTTLLSAFTIPALVFAIRTGLIP